MAGARGGPLLTDDVLVNTVIVVAAQYLLYGLVLVVALVWLTRSRRDKVAFAAEVVLGLALVGIGIWLASHLHSDPRPFVRDGTPSLFRHPVDDGFPSDHSAAGGLLAALVFRYKRLVGIGVAAGAAIVGWARVAAHVHHAQDVVAGLTIGVVAGALGIWVASLLLATARRRGLLLGHRARTTADRARRASL